MENVRRFGLTLIAGTLLFVGLPLLGWGLDDLPGFWSHPARLGYVVLIVVLQVGAAIRFPGVGRSGGEGTKLVQRQKIAVLLLQVISLVMMIVPPFSDRRAIAVIADADVIRYAGLIVFGAGFLLMNWSEATLGKQFSIQVTIQADHQLVTNGPYRLLRHPRYLGILAFNLGIALVFRSWLALGIVAALAVVLLWRIHDEEALMRQAFGTQWDRYAQHSWHLIPFVY